MPASPKPANQRQRRNRTSTAASLEAPAATKLALADVSTGHEWHPLTLRTWDTWWASPIVAEWIDADVPGLVQLAALVDDYWWADKPADRRAYLAEIRMSAKEFGLSPVSRRSLQWEVKRLASAVPAAAAPPPARRRGRTVLSVLQGQAAG